jgi:hypothetical protein
MADVTQLGSMTVIAAADMADASHPINQNASSQANGQAGVAAVDGRLYLQDNGSGDLNLALRSAGTWIIFGRESTVTPA